MIACTTCLPTTGRKAVADPTWLWILTGQTLLWILYADLARHEWPLKVRRNVLIPREEEK